MPNNKDAKKQAPKSFPQDFIGAAVRNDGEALKGLIIQGREENSLDENLLRVALQKCASKGHVESTRVLLENGAKTNIPAGTKGHPALHWAISQPQNKGHLSVAKLLLDNRGLYPGCPADKNWRDETGRTLVMSAALRNHHESLKLLLEAGADINARDLEQRTVLHNLAAENPGKIKWDTGIVSLLLDMPIDIDARDNKSRTALHWACATGKEKLVELLISRSRYQRPDLNLQNHRGKTALQLACSTDPVPAIVKLLLDAKADATIRGDGGYTCLHVSAGGIQASVDIVKLLLAYCPSLLNATTSTGLTALHCAAESGNLDIVACLLSQPGIKVNAKDAFYTTPLLRAAQRSHTPIAELLAPYNNLDKLSKYAIDACNGFEATVVDFRGAASDHQNLVKKWTVFEVLYGKDKDGEHLVTTRVDKMKSKQKYGNLQTLNDRASKPRFRWIHLPANNLVWVEALIAKAFIEGDCSDLEGFRAIERGFSHQHRGPKSHSQFMTPSCLRSLRGASSADSLPLYGALEDALHVSSGAPFSGYQSSPERFGRSRFPRHFRGRGNGRDKSQKPLWEDSSPIYDTPTVHAQMTAHGALRALTEEPEDMSQSTELYANRNNRASLSTDADQVIMQKPKAPKRKSRKSQTSQPIEQPQSSKTNQTKPGTEEDKTESSSSVANGIPLTQTPSRMSSFAASEVSSKTDTSQKRDGQNAEDQKSDSQKTEVRKSEGSQKGKNKDIPVYESNISLFMPYLHWETDNKRKLMQEAVRKAQFENLDNHSLRPMCHDETLIRAHLESSLHLRRTLDQFYLHGIDTEDRDGDQVVFRYCRDNNREEKVYMVDQLWMWVLGPGLIITAFPQRWQQPKNDPLNVLDGIIEDVNSRTGSAVLSVYDLALLITARTSGAFDRHRPGDEEYQFLDIFESSIGNVNDAETMLYRDFYEASATVHTWLSTHRREDSNDNTYPDVVDRFLDIGKETKLLQEIKDIRDELNMITMVITQQKSTIPALCDAICEDFEANRLFNKKSAVRRRTDDQRRTMEMCLTELDRMASLSQNIERSLLNLLDLKQKQSNAFEARFARDQAAGTVRQGQIIMVFTMVTIIFLPMSFLAAFFTIPIAQFQHNDAGNPNLDVSFVSRYIFGIGLGMSLLLIALAFSINPISALTRHIHLRWPQWIFFFRQEKENKRETPYSSFDVKKSKARKSAETTRSTRLTDAYIEEMKGFRQSFTSSRRSVYRNDLERG